MNESILITTSEFQHTGGHNVVINNLSREICKLGYDVTIGAFSFKDFPSNEIQHIEIKKNPVDIIRKEIEILEEHFKTSVSVISAHDPSVSKKFEIRLPDSIVDAYSKQYTMQRKYLSDSVQYWREGCFCKHYKNYDSMQVLTHPIWWTKDNKGLKEIMKSFVGGKWDNHKIQVEDDVEKYKKYLQKMSSKKV